MIRPRTHLPAAAALCLLAAAPGLAQAPEISGGADFSAPTAYPYFTSNPYGRRAGDTFPADPADYYRRHQAARALVRAEDCAAAIPMLERLAGDYPDDGATWFLLGLCQGSGAGDWPAAADSLTAALELGVAQHDPDIRAGANDIMVEMGAYYAQAGETELALDWVRRGLQARFDERPFIAEAPEAANLQGLPEFVALAGLPPDADLSRDDQWRYDIAFLRDQIRLLHADPDHHTPAAELDRALTELADAVPGLTDVQIVARLDMIIGMVGAGHDGAATEFAGRGALIPFALKTYFFSDGLFVIDAADADLVGARIDAVGDTPTPEVYAAVSAAMARDNAMQTRWLAPSRMMRPDMLEALGVAEDAGGVTLTITDRDGAIRTVAPERRVFARSSPALSAPPAGDAPLYLSRLDAPFWSMRLDDPDALYVQVNAIRDGDTESFAAFAERVRREAGEGRAVIFDVRHCQGGDGNMAAPLMRALIGFDADPDNALYVIIGRNTFSAAQLMITDLDRLATPVFVGEPSGSRPNAISESGRFALPFSGLSDQLSSQIMQHSMPEDHRIWIAPDVPVALSSSDFFARRDPAMEAIAALTAP